MDIDLPFFLELLKIPSVTGDVPQVNRAVAAVRAWLEARGVHCTAETMPDGRDFLYASVRPGERTPRLLFNAHLDVVPAPAALFEPRIVGDRIFGRGTQDCKGNAVAVAAALAALAGSGASVGAVFSTDEEEGGATTAAAVARGIRATGLAVVADAEPWAIVFAQKGVASFRLVAEGKGGHSSRPWALDNPIDKLFDGWARLRAAWPAPADETKHWHDTIAATVVRAGAVHNQVPDTAEMVVNVRFVEPGALPRVEALIREASGLRVERLTTCEPVVCDADAPALAALRGAMEAAFGREIPMKRMHGATDARHFAGPGAAPVAMVGIDGRACHEDAEEASLSSIAAYADLFASFARSFAAR
ncbi:MAG: M20/M25/M40 family metallo-hydrolase [Kiritimatiellae bacterium]|nr:M20/M25/M40 family metallo-hydrolase [Kiritimatiellia bacterium]